MRIPIRPVSESLDPEEMLSRDWIVALVHRSYHDQLQTCVCLLDPNGEHRRRWRDGTTDQFPIFAVHDAVYTRTRSLPLFTAVLAISSKFFRPELYESLLRIANRLVGQAIFDSVCAIEIIQAICMLHCEWSELAPRCLI